MANYYRKNYKCCAVCGDTEKVNVRLLWEREKDGARFSVCMACAESNKVNEKSVENYKEGRVINSVRKRGA